jgi:hypothetical protein
MSSIFQYKPCKYCGYLCATETTTSNNISSTGCCVCKSNGEEPSKELLKDAKKFAAYINDLIFCKLGVDTVHKMVVNYFSDSTVRYYKPYCYGVEYDIQKFSRKCIRIIFKKKIN